MKRMLPVSLMMMVLLASSSLAFDGNRKGFVVGGGLGFAPTATSSIDRDGPDTEDNGSGLGLNLVIGYAWDEHNMLVCEGNIASYSSNQTYIWLPFRTVMQGFYGASWYHYYGPQGRSFFTAVGLGLYVFEDGWSQWWGFEAHDPGAALLLGGGYEFARHFQVGVYVSTGKTSERTDDYNHSHISVLVSAVAF
ncbi:MAG: hypothetical protein KOO62_08245 [candidate division Zixibacteria bacterium]|nr:hypothetical protein [candidate division Zixibacteria bacterium]